MSWFKTDDKLHSHMKTMVAGIPAMGLWTVAGSWCADQLTDGFIPRVMVLRLDPEGDAHAASLVSAGFWHEAEKNGLDGWQFHDWEEYQPSRAKVESERKATADRQAKWREKRAAERGNGKSDGGTNGGRNGARNAVTHGVTNSAPTRPDPTRNTSSSDTDAADADDVLISVEAPAPKVDNGFDKFWDAYPRKEGKGRARKAYDAVLAKRVTTPQKILAAANGYARYCKSEKREMRYIQLPTTWLNDEGYDTPYAVTPAKPAAFDPWAS